MEWYTYIMFIYNVQVYYILTKMIGSFHIYKKCNILNASMLTAQKLINY